MLSIPKHFETLVMAGVAEKQSRITAKRKFSRIYNRSSEAIHNEVNVEIIEGKFNDLKLQWDEVQSTHDNYLFAVYPDDEEPFGEQDELWIKELDEKFEIMQKTKCDHLRKIKNKNIESTHIEINENLREREEGGTLQRILFLKEVESIRNSIKKDDSFCLKNLITSSMSDIKHQIEKCKVTHFSYVTMLSEEKARGEDEWINEIYDIYGKLKETFFNHIDAASKQELKEKRQLQFRLERVKMPKFEGNIRTYAKFKSDF